VPECLQTFSISNPLHHRSGLRCKFEKLKSGNKSKIAWREGSEREDGCGVQGSGIKEWGENRVVRRKQTRETGEEKQFHSFHNFSEGSSWPSTAVGGFLPQSEYSMRNPPRELDVLSL
jgi:hypothetical protein